MVIMSNNRRGHVVLLGVTIDYQLRYHNGLEQVLSEKGFAVHLVSAPGDNLSTMSQGEAVASHPIAMERAPNVLKDILVLFRWIAVVRKTRPSIVLLGTPKASLIGLLAATLCGVPHRVYEMHGLRMEGSVGVKRILLKSLESWTCRLANKVVAVSPSLAEAAIEAGIVDADRVKVIGWGSPNGVNIEHFRMASCDETAKRATKRTLGMSTERPVIVFIGRLTEDKGLSTLAEAMEILGRRIKAQLLIVGPVDDDSGMAGLERLKGTAEVFLAGPVPDVAPYLATADVLCLPSRREGLPTVVLEAFAARVPVVANRATGIVDLVFHDQTGFLTPIGDASALAVGLERALTDMKSVDTCVQKADDLVAKRFSTKDVQFRWAQFLEDLVNGD